MVANAFLNVSLSIYHKKDDLIALMEADRGALYNNASSPKPSPASICLLMTPLISTVSFPSCRIKKELAGLFCFIKYCPSITLQSLNFYISIYFKSPYSIKEENVKCPFKLFKIIALSFILFF